MLRLLSLVMVCLLLGSTNNHDISRPANVQQYLQKFHYLATELNQSTGIPIPITLAVAGLESNWGKSELALQANNHFGIKAKHDWEPNQYCKLTQEYQLWYAYFTEACFRSYPLIRKSYEDFGQFITTRPNYRNLQQAPVWNYRAWAEGLQLGGYATDPEYAEKVLRIIWRYQLYDYATEG